MLKFFAKVKSISRWKLKFQMNLLIYEIMNLISSCVDKKEKEFYTHFYIEPLIHLKRQKNSYKSSCTMCSGYMLWRAKREF